MPTPATRSVFWPRTLRRRSRYARGVRHHRRLFALIGIVVAAGATVAACDLASNGIATDTTAADASADGTSEGSPSSDAMDELAEAMTGDAPNDVEDAGFDAIVDAGSFHCAAAFVSNCLACPGAPSLCVDTCVASCHDSCPTSQIECFACTAGNTPSNSVCVPPANATGCIAGSNVRCTCLSTDAGECPGATQGCSAGLCLACGESVPVNTDMLVCKLGTDPDKCDNGGSGNKLTCH